MGQKIYLMDNQIVEIPDGYQPEDFFSIFVKCDGEENEKNCKGYIKSEFADIFHEVHLEQKIRYEIRRWISMLTDLMRFNAAQLHADQELPKVPRALLKLYDPMGQEGNSAGPEGIARALRMLTVFQRLLIDHSDEIRNDQSSEICQIRKLSEEVRDAAESLPSAASIGGKWKVSLGLLTVVALAYSQCQWHRPILWEAHSAGRARDELARHQSNRWRNPWRDHHQLLDVIAYLIRYQSEPGQFYRGTGAASYRQFDRTGFMFGSDLEDALKIIALAQEARNKQIETECYHLPDGCAEIVHTGVERSQKTWHADPAELKEFWNGLASNRETSRYTWGFSSWFSFQDQTTITDFKWFIEENRQDLLPHTAMAHFDQNRIAKISFGRRQAYDLKEDIASSIQKVVEAYRSGNMEETKCRFNQDFRLELVEVPDCFGKTESEYVIRVLLQDHLAVRRLVPFL